jgi:hypothetical protein
LLAIGFGLASIAWITAPPNGITWADEARPFVDEPSPASTDLVAAWEFPVVEHQVLKDFSSPNGDYSAGHRGVDFESFNGEEVLAPSAGVVRFAGLVAGRSLLSIDLADGVVAEVEPVCPSVVEGEAVVAGQIVGVVCVGAENHCEVVCLHLSARRFSIEYTRGFIYLNPLIFLDAFQPSHLVAIGAIG